MSLLSELLRNTVRCYDVCSCGQVRNVYLTLAHSAEHHIAAHVTDADIYIKYIVIVKINCL